MITYLDTWPLHMTLLSLNSTYGGESITHIFSISLKAQLFGASKNLGIITWHIRDFFYSHWASLLNQPRVVICWPFYNSKSSKPNRSASPFGGKNRKILSYYSLLVKTGYFAIAIAGPRICCIFCKNIPLAGKNELAKAVPGAPTNDNVTLSQTPAVSRISTPALAPLLASAKFVAKYTNADL